MVIRGSGLNLMNEPRLARGPALVFLLQIYSIITLLQVVDFSPSLSPTLACRALYHCQATTACAGSRQSSFFVSRTQIVRAILLARAIATSIFGFRIREPRQPRTLHDRFAPQPVQPGHRTDDQQSADIGLPGLGDAAQPLFAT